MNDVTAAMDYADQGGHALHLHTLTSGHPLIRRYPVIAHLIDNDAVRLEKTARRLGVRVIKIERKGVRGQHIDLCGKPLEKAKSECE